VGRRVIAVEINLRSESQSDADRLGDLGDRRLDVGRNRRLRVNPHDP
jgi:hypothetical protein